MSPAQSSPAQAREAYDVVVVGAGFAGMYMLHRLRGLGFSARVYEQGAGVGGTWYWNRYPGARCDVESMQYSYSFSEELQQEWDWSERYAPQAEILKYANHVADRFDLRRDIQFDTRVERAVFDEQANAWSVKISDGKMVEAKFVVLATGCLSNARKPDIQGLDNFKGPVYHTGNWPQTRGFRRLAGWPHRHRFIRHPVGPHHCRAGKASHRLPAHREFLDSRPQCRVDRRGTQCVPE